MCGEEPLDILFVAHGPFVWWNVVVVLPPVSDLVELYPWKSGIVFLAPGVGLLEFEPTARDSVPYVRLRVVGVVPELVNCVLRVVLIAFFWHGFIIGGVGSLTAWVRAKVEETSCGWIWTRWLGAHLGVAMLLSIAPRGLVILGGDWDRSTSV